MPPPPPPPASPPPVKQTCRHRATMNEQLKSTVQSSAQLKNNHQYDHHQIINSFLSSINVKSRLDQFGIAYLPMKKLVLHDITQHMVMVIEAPPTKDAFQLYTHFNATESSTTKANNILSEKNEDHKGSAIVMTPSCQPNSNDNHSNENCVLNNLLQHGKHKGLSLTRVCEERVRFALQGKNAEITSKTKLKGVLKMFVKVSLRMKKKLEE